MGIGKVGVDGDDVNSDEQGAGWQRNKKEESVVEMVYVFYIRVTFMGNRLQVFVYKGSNSFRRNAVTSHKGMSGTIKFAYFEKHAEDMSMGCGGNEIDSGEKVWNGVTVARLVTGQVQQIAETLLNNWLITTIAFLDR